MRALPGRWFSPLRLVAGRSIRREDRRLRLAAARPSAPGAAYTADLTRFDPRRWTVILNGAGSVGGAAASSLAHHCTEVQFGAGGMRILTRPDPDLESEDRNFRRSPAAGQYNNASVLDEGGCMPVEGRDLLVRATMQVSDNFYGTAGCVLQPQGMIGVDGAFDGFAMLGIVLFGPESSMFGSTGAVFQISLGWWPCVILPVGDLPRVPTCYEIRLHRARRDAWSARASVDSAPAAELDDIPPFGPLSSHLWSDNYWFAAPSPWTHPFPVIRFQSGDEKWVSFTRLEVSHLPAP
jgi:hypothetical protein